MRFRVAVPPEAREVRSVVPDGVIRESVSAPATPFSLFIWENTGNIIIFGIGMEKMTSIRFIIPVGYKQIP
jgi:hypothetical protein